MRTKTLASLLILCGSTAAIAQISTEPQDGLTNNSVVENSLDPLGNTTAPEPMEPETGDTTTETTDDAPPQG